MCCSNLSVIKGIASSENCKAPKAERIHDAPDEKSDDQGSFFCSMIRDYWVKDVNAGIEQQGTMPTTRGLSTG
jgi:hypothetical protein